MAIFAPWPFHVPPATPLLAWSAQAISPDACTCTARASSPHLRQPPRRVRQGQFEDIAAPSWERQRHRPGADPNEPWTLGGPLTDHLAVGAVPAHTMHCPRGHTPRIRRLLICHRRIRVHQVSAAAEQGPRRPGRPSLGARPGGTRRRPLPALDQFTKDRAPLFRVAPRIRGAGPRADPSRRGERILLPGTGAGVALRPVVVQVGGGGRDWSGEGGSVTAVPISRAARRWSGVWSAVCARPTG